jgi:hypothetical protein
MKDDRPAGSASDCREELPQDLVTIANPELCRADFTYSITPTKLVICDTGKGEKSVIEDLPAVLRKIEYWHQGSVAHFELTLIDANGRKTAPGVVEAMRSRSSSSPIGSPIAER